MELFTWLLEVTEDEIYEGARIVWTARFEPAQAEEQLFHASAQRSEGRKFTTRFEIQKDDIQAVVPISKVSAKHRQRGMDRPMAFPELGGA